LNSLHPCGYWKKKVSQVPEKNDPEGKVKEKTGAPQKFVRLKEVGKPEEISDESPDHAQPGLGGRGGDDTQGDRRPNPDKGFHPDPKEKDPCTEIGQIDEG
jgi:hypothetical protein